MSFACTEDVPAGSGKQSEEERFTNAVSPGSRPPPVHLLHNGGYVPCALEFRSLRNKDKERA